MKCSNDPQKARRRRRAMFRRLLWKLLRWLAVLAAVALFAALIWLLHLLSGFFEALKV